MLNHVPDDVQIDAPVYVGKNVSSSAYRPEEPGSEAEGRLRRPFQAHRVFIE